MRSMIARWVPFLLSILLFSVSLTAFAVADSNAEDYMPYKQFTLIDASELVVPPNPLDDSHMLAEGDAAITKYNEWWNARLEQHSLVVPNLDRIRAFTRRSSQIILSNGSDSNALYSPINTWFYLEILSNLTDDNTRAQILQVLGSHPDTYSVADIDALYKALYWDDGLSVWRPASSLWMNQHTAISDELKEKLAEQLHTSVFQGPMGEEVYDEAFRSWLNKQTNDLLTEFVDDLRLNRDTGISLCATLYLRCLWSMPFNKEATATDIFYTGAGEAEVDFMRKEESGSAVYAGDGFSSTIWDLQDGGYVTLILPDGGKTVDEILSTDEFFDFLFKGKEWGNIKYGKVKLSMPKIDIMTAIPLSQTLAQLGVTDVFDSEKIVFSKEIQSEEALSLSSVDQYSRLIMNEDGVEAASMIVTEGSSLRIASEEEFEFILNRPFIFAVFSETNVPIFLGVYSKP